MCNREKKGLIVFCDLHTFLDNILWLIYIILEALDLYNVTYIFPQVIQVLEERIYENIAHLGR